MVGDSIAVIALEETPGDTTDYVNELLDDLREAARDVGEHMQVMGVALNDETLVLWLRHEPLGDAR